MTSLHVAVLANLKKNAPILPDAPADYWADLDSEHTVEAIADALRQWGHQAGFWYAEAQLPNLGHDFPSEFQQSLAQALEFLFQA